MDSGLDCGFLQGRFISIPEVGCTLDISRMGLGTSALTEYEAYFEAGLAHMRALEGGALANPGESRRVGHYWLRDRTLAPDETVREELQHTQQLPRACARQIRRGEICTPSGAPFRQVLWVGMGGSSLGPQFLAAALCGDVESPMRLAFLDNADPDGIGRTLSSIDLSQTLVVAVSKSGTTSETNIALECCEQAFRSAGLRLPEHAVAITSRESPLWRWGKRDDWLAVFSVPLWVGGRTSLCAAGGLFFLELFGLDADKLLDGARRMDEATRAVRLQQNPAGLLAAAWHHATAGAAKKAMVLLPYSDLLQLFGRYAQQLVMESIGKKFGLDGRTVHQGLTVYGNKGSTDQHALVQQLREGPDDCFALFVEVIAPLDSCGQLEGEHTVADRHRAAFLGTRKALATAGRASATLSIPRVDEKSVGALVALFERAVGFYADWVGVNAYDQPGVEAGKRAAVELLSMKEMLRSLLTKEPQGIEQLARAAQCPADVDAAFYLLRGLSECGEEVAMEGGEVPAQARFYRSS